MEEDILYGKQRHFFGGIAPSNMRTFTGKFNSDGSVLTIVAELPLDTILDGQMVCSVGGAVIRKSHSHYPKDEFDGELVADIKRDSTFTINNSHEGITYLAAFPYSKQGVYNRNKANRSQCGSNNPYTYLYGYDIDLDDPNPDTRVSYPDDVENREFEPARMNYDADTFEYGDWTDVPGDKFMPRPCMLKYDGIVDHYLYPNNYSLRDDGVTPSSVADKTFAGNAMMEWSKIYTKRWEEDGVYHFRCSDIKIDDDWDCWCNYDKNDNEIDHFYTPIYFGSYVITDGVYRLRSISDTTNKTSINYSDAVTYATNNGADWHIETLADRLLIQDLLVMIGKSTDGQTIFGYGRANANLTGGTAPGYMNAKGMFWGNYDTAVNNTVAVKVFGMENWWGSLNRLLSGWFIYAGTHYVKITRGTHDGSSVSDYAKTFIRDGYINAGAVSSTNSNYISEMATFPYGRLPIATGGSASTYECDRFGSTSFTNNIAYAAVVGGGRNDGSTAGPFYTWFNAQSSDETYGASLSCKPSAT